MSRLKDYVIQTGQVKISPVSIERIILNMKRLVCLLFLWMLAVSLYAMEPSLRDKIGQMLIIGFHGKSIDSDSPIASAINQENIGGVILFDFNQQSQTFDKNIESPQQVKLLNQQLQRITEEANKSHHRLNLPLLISVDYEGGQVNRLHQRYGFPEIESPKTIGKMPLDEANDSAKRMAHTLHSTGFNLDFFPSLDVDVNPENPIISKKERSFSSDPDGVTQYAQIYSRQFLSNQIECAYKHFPGHGSSVADTHLGFVDITDTWSEEELLPFLQSLSKPNHCHMIMVAHVVNRKLDITGAPATLSPAIINGLLRHDLQFDGVVITDDMQMKAIADYYGLETAVTLSINAGVDMLIFGNQLVDKLQDPKELIDIIEKKVRSGKIPVQRINEAYGRIVKMKQSLAH